MRGKVWVLCWILGSVLGLGFAMADGQDGDGKPQEKPGEEKPDAEKPDAEKPAAEQETPTRNDWARSALTANRVDTRARRREGGSGTDKPARSALAWLIRHQHGYFVRHAAGALSRGRYVGADSMLPAMPTQATLRLPLPLKPSSDVERAHHRPTKGFPPSHHRCHRPSLA